MSKQRDREAQLQSLEQFSKATTNQLNDIVSTLGWSMNNITHGKITICCPFDPAHRVPEDRLEKHLESCQWTAEGYQKQDVPLSYPSLRPCAPSTITFDEKLQDEVLSRAKIENPLLKIDTYESYTWPELAISCVGGRLIPRTSNRLLADFTSDERRALYDYVIANTRKPEIGEDIADINKPKAQNGETKNTFLELLAQERNLKRRRAKHRGVHTNKKSHLEIMREVIEQQMEMFTEYLMEEQDSLIPSNVVHSSHTKSVNGLGKLNGNNWNSTVASSKEVKSKRDYTRLQKRDVPTEHRQSRYDERKSTQRNRKSSDKKVRSKNCRSLSRTRKDKSNTERKDHRSRDRGSHSTKDKYHEKEDRRHESSRSRRHSWEHDRERHGNSSKREEQHFRNKNFPMYHWQL